MLVRLRARLGQCTWDWAGAKLGCWSVALHGRNTRGTAAETRWPWLWVRAAQTRRSHTTSKHAERVCCSRSTRRATQLLGSHAGRVNKRRAVATSSHGSARATTRWRCRWALACGRRMAVRARKRAGNRWGGDTGCDVLPAGLHRRAPAATSSCCSVGATRVQGLGCMGVEGQGREGGSWGPRNDSYDVGTGATNPMCDSRAWCVRG